MSSAGHVVDMINRVAQNRQLLLARRQKTAYLRDKLDKANLPKKSGLAYKEVTPEELQLIKDKIRKNIKRERQRAIIYTVLVMTILLMLSYFLIQRFLLRYQ